MSNKIKDLFDKVKALNDANIKPDHNGITVWTKIGDDHVILDRHNVYRKTVLAYIKESPAILREIENSDGIYLENYLGFDSHVFKCGDGGQDLKDLQLSKFGDE